MELTLTGYATLRLLGSGQFGDVYLVQRRHDARLFAAKVSRNHSAAASASDLQEAQLLQRLRHPNVIQCEGIIRPEATRGLVIVMEYAPQGDLEGLLRGYSQRQEKLPEDEIMRIFLQIAMPLAYLHEQRVLHRDLKPKNILLDQHGVVKLSDFGVSRSLLHTMDAAQTITGTPYYMSPELMDNQPYDGKTDVWSLGCILYELAALSPPFQAKALAALVMQIVGQSPPPLPAQYSSELQAVTARLLAKDPSNRPSIHEVLVMPFVQRHLFRLASMAPSSGMAQSSLEVAKPPSRPPPAITAPVPPGFGLVKPVAIEAPRQMVNGAGGGGADLARQIFLENQAAALRNKERVDRERVAPAQFLSEDVTPEKVDRPRSGQLQVNALDFKEIARQAYLENARAAKLFKQRAMDDMKGQAEAVVGLTQEPQHPQHQLPPPPPLSRKENLKDYETQLEEERKRVRMERKLLHERMRDVQASNGPPEAQGTTEEDALFQLPAS